MRLILWELKIEFKNPAILLTFLFFSISLASLFYYAFPVGWNNDLMKGGYLIVMFFMVTLVSARAQQRDREAGAALPLLMNNTARSHIYFARMIARSLLYLLIIIVYIPIHSILLLGFFDLQIALNMLLPGMFLSVTLAALATLVALIASGNRFRELIVPVIFFPAALPAFIIHAAYFTGESAGIPSLVALAVLYTSIGYLIYLKLRVEDV